MAERVPESDCDTPCQNGADDTAGASSTMCGGAWRNSVYALSTNYWESPGYDDRGWQSAADLGPNGVAPWYHRPNIADTANWIWSTDAGFNGAYDQTPGAGRVQIDPDGTHHNGGYDYGHIDSPGIYSTDEYGNCFLRSNCNVDEMTTGNHWGSYPAWDVYIKSEGRYPLASLRRPWKCLLAYYVVRHQKRSGESAFMLTGVHLVGRLREASRLQRVDRPRRV